MQSESVTNPVEAQDLHAMLYILNQGTPAHL